MGTTIKDITKGKIPIIALCTISGILECPWENTMTKENRYRLSGITHSSGTGVISVVTKEVTPSIKLEGTKASPIHLKRLSKVGLLESPPATREVPLTSGEPPPAPTGGLGEPSAITSSSSSWTMAGAVVLAGEERQSS